MIKNIGRRILGSRVGRLGGRVGTAAQGYGERQAKAAMVRGRQIDAAATARARSAGMRVDNAVNSAGASRFSASKGLVAGGIAGVGAVSFASGFGSESQRNSRSLMNLAFGDPNFDEYTMGRQFSTRQLLAPLPLERIQQSTVPFAQTYGYGGPVGTVGGALAGLKLAGIKGGLVGAIAGGYLGNKAFGQRAPAGAVVTKQTFSDAFRAHRYMRESSTGALNYDEISYNSKRRARQNQVNGNIAFGMYNARLG